MIYFLEPISWTRISYNKVHKKNDQRWKIKNFPLVIKYDWPTHCDDLSLDEGYLMYLDFVWLLGESQRYLRWDNLESLVNNGE